jgi:hypothetical protein
LLIALAPHSSHAQGQLARSFVSAAIGSDANDCNRTTPCRTFQRAHDNTFDQGEVTVLDTGGYGAVTITKSISIVSEVGEASILVSGGNTGITINAPNGYVNLRGLTVQGIGFGGGDGIVVTSAFALTITNCVIRNLTADGIDYAPNGSARLAVSNTLVADNGGTGILVNGSNGPVRLDLTRVEVRHNSAWGLAVNGTTGGVHTSVADSVFSGNLADGIKTSGIAGLPSTVVVMHSVISNNGGSAVAAGGPGAFIAIGQSMISGNATTWSATGTGTVRSFGDNDVFGNFDGDPAMTVIAKK